MDPKVNKGVTELVDQGITNTSEVRQHLKFYVEKEFLLERNIYRNTQQFSLLYETGY